MLKKLANTLKKSVDVSKKFVNVLKSVNSQIICDFFHKNVFWLPFWLVFGAVLCMINKFEFFWDFKNYHFYNPWKLLDSDGYDIYMPLASINSFLNPLIDVPLYLLIKYFNNYPLFIYAIQGLWFGALLFIFQKITLLFWNKQNSNTILCIFLTILMAMTGEATWYQAGTSTNEIQIAMLIMLGVYATLKMIVFPNTQTARKFLLIGLLLGATLGLKQTSMSYSFALGLTLILFHKTLKRPLYFISMFALGGFIGCLLIYGPTMYHNYVTYDNPFLPFLNSLFHSEYLDMENFHDRRYMPYLHEFWYYPYIWEKRAAEIEFSDKRGAIFYTISWMFLLYAGIYRLIFRQRIPFLRNNLNAFVCVWMLISYLLWSLFFSIFRYLIPMEMFFAIFIIKFINHFLFCYHGRLLMVFQFIVMEMILYTTLTTPFRLGYDETTKLRQKEYLHMEKITLPENTLVKFYNFPIGFMAPLLARDNPHFKAVIYVDESYGMKTDFTERGKFAEIRRQVLAEHTGPTVIIAATTAAEEAMEKYYRLIDTKNPHYRDLEEYDRTKIQKRINKAKKDLHLFEKYSIKSINDFENLEKIAASTYNPKNKPSYLINNAEISNMFCRKIDINILDEIVICVPHNLKNKILHPQTEQDKPKTNSGWTKVHSWLLNKTKPDVKKSEEEKEAEHLDKQSLKTEQDKGLPKTKKSARKIKAPEVPARKPIFRGQLKTLKADYI